MTLLYSAEAFENAMKIYNILQQEGTFSEKDDPKLFRTYRDDEVAEMLLALQRINKVRIEKFEDSLELVPEIDNEIHRHSNKELLHLMGLKKNGELYTIQFIWITLLSKFYGDQYENFGEPRAFVPIDELRESVDEYVNIFKKQTKEKIDEMTKTYEMSLNEIITTWDQLGTITEETKSIARSKTKDYGFIMKGLRFWVDQRLIQLRDESEIVLTGRGRIIPEIYYHQEDTIHKIENMLKETKSKNQIMEYSKTVTGAI